MKEIHRKGDSLETSKSGIYGDMNTAVVLNQPTVLRTNDWQGGQHYPMFPSGYHRPVPNLLPIADLKQLSLGKTDNMWANLNGVYSHQLSVVFNPSHAIMKAPISASTGEQSQCNTQICMANIPQYSPTLTQNNTKRTIQNLALLYPTQFRKTANLVNPATTTGHRIWPSNPQDITKRVSQTITKTTQGYQQSVIKHFGGYMIQKPNNSVNVTSSSSGKLTELSPYKENPIPQTVQAKQQTRKRSSSWPPGSGLTQKKPKDDKTRDEEYQNLEMDVARILIRDIPFPVVSVGDKSGGIGATLVGSGGRRDADKQAEMLAVVGGDTQESKKQDSGSNPLTGGMYMPSRSALESGGKVSNEHASLWSGEVLEFNKQSDVLNVESAAVNVESAAVNVGNANPEIMSCSARKRDEEVTKSVVGGGGMTGSEKQEPTLGATKETNVSILTRGNLESEKEEKKSNTRGEEMAPMASGGSTKQAKVASLWSAKEIESEKPMNPLIPCCGVMQEPNQQAKKSMQQDTAMFETQKDSSNSETKSRASLHFDNEKENHSKNMVGPNKVVFTCEQCMVTFESTQDLISHTASHTSSNFTFKCNVCTQVFRSTNGLQKHIEFHADHRNNFQCSFCFKPFSDRDSLEEHIIESHMSKRPHKCSYCPKAFRDPGSLQKHIRIHTGERPYKCTACEKSFAEYSSLRKHYRVHTGEQPYKCQYCSKAFSISGNLQRHILIHTGERPYKCSECSKTFNNPSHLRRHEKNLHSKLEREK